MRWSPQQDAALIAAARWLRAPDKPVFRLFGYAGTGKTTLARHLAADATGRVAFACFTGKAASVMRSMGCDSATTIHRLIYRPIAEVDGKPRFELDHDKAARYASLIIIDECSMVDALIGRDLMSLGVPILAIGDTAQLPPIEGRGFFTADEPDVMLTEVHRQARDNPIIDMATIVREGGRLEVGNYGDSRIIARGELEAGDFDRIRLEADQMLVGHVTRRANNVSLRALRGFEGTMPAAGDRLVCLRNDHALGLLNGAVYTVRNIFEDPFEPGEISMLIAPENGDAAIAVESHAAFFNGGAHDMPYSKRRDYAEFDYGYALTVHKAQGSQWDNVMLLNESRCFGADSRRWVYTAITRAAKRITVLK
jgi:ATP-dependent exoDNAse (exonuclease V) alpha subunit